MVRILGFLIFISAFHFQSAFAAKEVMFEGYYKLMSLDKHIGYSLVRYEYDNAEKKFFSTYLTKISNGGSEVMESLSATAEADDTMTPVKFKYVGLLGKESKTFEGTFKKGKAGKLKMTLTRTEGSAKPVITSQDLDSKILLSTFLTYRMLRSKTGIQTNSQLKYGAIAEEEGTLIEGTAEVLNEEKYKGFTAFKIKNTFKNVLFISHVTDKGEALVTTVPDAKLTSELVAKAAEAVGTIGLPEAIAKSLFGHLPLGDKNVVSQFFKSQEKSAPAGSKTEGVPAGQGIMISPKEEKKKESP